MAVSASKFENAIKNAGIPKLKWWKGWDKNDWNGRKGWNSKTGNPLALLLHHNGGASTDSSKAEDNKDCKKDENGAKFVNRHPDFDSPASQFFLRRCGQLDINGYTQCYHAGKGDFKGTEWEGHKIPKDSGNSYMMGIEIASKGLKDDLTEAQWETLAKLAVALKDLYGWKDTSTYYFPRHKDWAPGRKSDIKASNSKVQKKFTEYAGQWDGKIPDIEGIYNAEADPELKNPAAWRLACRLADLGYYKGEVAEKGSQGYPAKAVANFNEDTNMEDKSKYGPNAHKKIFGIPKDTPNEEL